MQEGPKNPSSFGFVANDIAVTRKSIIATKNALKKLMVKVKKHSKDEYADDHIKDLIDDQTEIHSALNRLSDYLEKPGKYPSI